MATPELSARLRYLNDSAHLLAVTAPSTARYLMSRCNSLVFDNDLELSESHRRKVCGACGTIIIMGWEARVEIFPRRGRRGKALGEKEAPPRRKDLVYTCESCSRTTRFSIAPAASKARPLKSASTSSTKNLIPQLATPGTSTNVITPANPSPNSSSKRRAKTRKQSGLGAILANKKASEAPKLGFGLDLMDFMKRA